MRREEPTDIPKIIILTLLLLFVFMSSSTILTLYPQKLLISNGTSIESILKVTDSGIMVRGNMVQISPNDRIVLGGRDYVRLTANQIQLNGNTYREGIRTLSPSFYQNVLFEQFLGEFTTSARIGIENKVIVLTRLSDKTITVTTLDSLYNVEFIDDTTYIKSGDVLIRLLQKDGKTKVYLVGFKEYDSIWLRT